MGDKAFWNKDKTASVVLGKVKEFSISFNTYDANISVRGWYNKENFFSFGDTFKTISEAQKFVELIHQHVRAAWNKKKDASVVLSKVKEFAIIPNGKDSKFTVRGWFNQENYFTFGNDFIDEEEARKFVEKLHNRI